MKVAFELDSYGELKLKGYKWMTQEPVKGILILSHGMAEHIDRYDDFATFLNSHGFHVYGHSHRGHGKTAGSIAQLGILGENGWMKAKEDLRRVVQMGIEDCPHCPIFVLGHSMGSFLLRDFLLDYSDVIEGAILSGTGFAPKWKLKLGKNIAAVQSKIKGTKHPSKLVDRLTFSSYNKAIKSPKTEFDWLSRDDEKVRAYIDDVYCGQVHSAGFFYDFSSNLLRILYAPVFENKKTQLPIFIFSGDEDPVGDYGKGVVKSKKYYESEGFHTSLKLYPGGRHEMLNEINRDEVYNDVLNWLTKCLASDNS